mgnify:CR=1 FL=1
MKRYLIIGYWMDEEGISSKDEITSEDLVKVKNRDYKKLIDIQENKWFDAEVNEWKSFP